MNLFEQMVSLIEAETLENLLQIQRAIQNQNHDSEHNLDFLNREQSPKYH